MKEQKREKIKDYSLKHSASHLMASAVLALYPKAKLAIGPPTEDGFYYDFDELPISDKDLSKIEKKMRQIAAENAEFEYSEESKEDAKKLLEDQPYKKEILEDLDGKITFYSHGKFKDLCEGPHVKSTKELQHFKLMRVAGAYWRGDADNKMLTRIYGIVFPTEKELKEYLQMLEEAKKRDHKKLGKQLDLFTFSPLVGPGLPLWTPRGTLLRNTLDEYIWELRKEKGYQKVTIPHITKKELYEKSGHWSKFKDDLFKIETREKHVFAMKPMNCPHHAQIFASKMRSYRDMPQRYCETTMVYRDEQSGELHGLSRVRSITQDDAHAFCRRVQIGEEIEAIWDIVDTFYSSFGFELVIRLSTHDPENMDAFLGTKDVWEQAEEDMLKVINKRKADFVEGVGEAAFYGPKIDFIARDSLKREWQVATIQLDFNQPKGFDLKCTNEEGQEERIVMIHAAIMGSIERFASILIEHTAGKFPLWLNPLQVKVLTVTEKNDKFAEEVYNKLKDAEIHAELDLRPHSISKKVREAQLEKASYMITIGEKEETNKTIAVRSRDGKVDFGVKVEDFIKDIKEQIKKRA